MRRWRWGGRTITLACIPAASSKHPNVSLAVPKVSQKNPTPAHGLSRQSSNRILLPMNAWIIVVAAILAQQGADDPDAQPYLIPLNDPIEINGVEKDEIYVFFEEDHWDRPLIDMELDRPWLPRTQRQVRVRKSNIAVDSIPLAISPGERDEYHEEAAARAGYAKRPTANGMDWVPEGEWTLLQRSRELVEEAHSVDETGLAAPAESTDTSGHLEAESSSMGFLNLWGPHIGIGLATLVLAALVAKRWALR